MKPSTQDQAEGKFHEVKGKIKEKLGKATKNPNLENEGTSEKASGKVQNRSARLKRFWAFSGPASIVEGGRLFHAGILSYSRPQGSCAGVPLD